MQLNLLHIDCVGSDSLCHHNAVAGSTGMVCRDSIRKTGIIACHQFKVCTKTAGCKYNRFGIDGIVRGIILRFYTDRLSVFHQDFGGLGIQHNLNSLVFRNTAELFYQIFADSPTAFRLVQVLSALAAACGMHICERSPDGSKPVNCVRAVFGKCAHQIGVCQIMSEAIGIRNEVFYGAVIQSELGFQLGSGCIHAAFCPVAVSADHRHLLQHKDIHALLAGTDCCRQTGTAGADNDNVTVKRDIFFLHGRCCRRLGLKHGGINAAGSKRFPDCGFDCRAGHGRAGYTVYQNAVGINNGRGQFLYRHGSDARRLVLFENFDGVDLLRIRHNLDNDLAVNSLALSSQRLGTVRHLCSRSILSGGGFFRRGCAARSRFGQSCLNCRTNRCAGNGRTGHAVHIKAVRLNDLGRHLFHCHRSDSRRLAGTVDLHRRDGAFVHGYVHNDLAHTGGFRCIGARYIRRFT